MPGAGRGKAETMQAPQSIAEQLREAIRASGLSYGEIAEAADLSKGLVAAFMAPNSKKKSINVDTAEALAMAINKRLRLLDR